MGKIPIEIDIDKSFLFSPRCVEGNKVYCVIGPSEIPENNNLPINVGIDDNPVLAEIYMKYGNKKHKLKNYNLIIFCSLSLCLLYYTNRTNVDIRKK